MDARQDRLANPLGMDEACENCGLSESRERVVHGYGAVDADVLFVGETPGAAAEATGVPFAETGLWSILRELGFAAGDRELSDAYLTYLARCRHPDRGPTDAEVRACDPYLTAEVRMINPGVLVPVGGRALRALVAEHTTADPDDVDVEAAHAEPMRGRGFELIPTIHPGEQDAGEREAFLAAMREAVDRDYHGQKGRRGRSER